MNVYEIEFNAGFPVERTEHILAETFEEAYAKAQKLLAKRRRKTEDDEILSIQFKYVKPACFGKLPPYEQRGIDCGCCRLFDGCALETMQKDFGARKPPIVMEKVETKL